MSIKIMSLIFDANHELITSTQKLVLLALADHANDEGYSIYPSMQKTANRTALSARTVRKTIRELEQAGIINITRQGGGRITNEYRLIANAIPRNDVPSSSELDSVLPRNDVPSSSELDSDESLVNHQLKPKENNFPPPPSFLAESIEFMETWQDFIKHRQEIKHKLTPLAARKLFAKFAKYESSLVIEALTKAIENGWTGVFPESIKTEKSNQQEQSQRLPKGV